MSLNDILQIERERVRRERITLTTIYDRMKNRINNSVKVKSKECVYTIPEFIPGYPLIDVEKTMKYLINKLTREGFIAVKLTELVLYITWDPLKLRQLDEQTKAINSEKQEPLYSKYDNQKQLWNPNSNYNHNGKTIEKQLVEKEFERATENFIDKLIISKKGSKS